MGNWSPEALLGSKRRRLGWAQGLILDSDFPRLSLTQGEIMCVGVEDGELFSQRGEHELRSRAGR